MTVIGPLGIPGTGYYSADLYQEVDKIYPEPSCVRQATFRDYSKVKPESSINRYQVSIKINYKVPHGHIDVTVKSKDHTLNPWQPYASYWLTGLFAFNGSCANDFTMSRLHGTPEAKPWMMENRAYMDSESAAAKNIRIVKLDFTCQR